MRRETFQDGGNGLRLFGSVRPITRAGALRDTLAGFTLAAMNVPQALGYTRIAGTPVLTGLYTLLLPLVTFAALGSSRYLMVAADSATAAILAGGLKNAPIAWSGDPRLISSEVIKPKRDLYQASDSRKFFTFSTQ